MVESKAQTATEYIVIIAVVILIAVVVAQQISSGLGSASEVSTRTNNVKSSVGNIVVMKHVIGNDSSKLVIQNNNPYDIKVNNLSLDGVTCTTPNLPKYLRIGGSVAITCTNINGTVGDKYSKDVVINYMATEVIAIYDSNLGEISGKVTGELGVKEASSSVPSVTLDWNSTLSGSNSFTSIAIDSSSNSYVVGNNLTGFYVAKFNSSGSLVWKTYTGSPSSSVIYKDLIVDSLGNVYVVGDYESGMMSGFMVISKFNSSGAFIWNRSISSTGTAYSYGESIAIGPLGDIYASGTIIEATITRFDSSGNNVWTSYFETPTTRENFEGVAVDSSGDIYVTGMFDDTGVKDILLAKYNSSGSQLWNKTFSEGGSDHPKDIVLDSSSNIFITGDIGGNFYVAKYNSSGSPLWNITDSNGDHATSIAIDSSSNIYVTGSSIGGDYYTAKYNSSGSRIWNITYGETGSDKASGIALDSSNNVYIVGDGGNIIKYSQS